MKIKSNLIQPTAKSDGSWYRTWKQGKAFVQKPKYPKVNRARIDYNVDASTWK